MYQLLQENEGETNMDINNTRMNNVDGLTTNVSGGIDKKRSSEMVEESTHETIDDHHAHRNKKMTTMNMTKEI